MNEELQAQVKLFKQAMLAVGTILDLPPIKLNVKQYEKTCKEHGINLIEIPFTEENLISYDYIMRKAGY